MPMMSLCGQLRIQVNNHKNKPYKEKNRIQWPLYPVIFFPPEFSCLARGIVEIVSTRNMTKCRVGSSICNGIIMGFICE